MKKQLNFYILIILLVACGTPEKKQQVQKKQNPLAEGLCTSLKPDETCQEIKQETDSVQDFWNIFKSGEIEKAQDLISKMKKDLKDQPDNANLHKYYAFANTFYFAEYGRLNKDRDPSFMDAISDSISHF